LIHVNSVISPTQAYVQGHQLAIVEVAPPVPVAKVFMEPESDDVSGLIHLLWTLTRICIQKLSENTRAVVPTTTQYIVATSKQALGLLQTAASVIPVPLLQEALGIAVKIIEICEVCQIHAGRLQTVYIFGYQEASDVQQKVKELQKRVSHLMIVIVDNVTVKYEEGSEVVVKAVQGIEKDVKDLLRCVSYT
jgi:hypothetical protein